MPTTKDFKNKIKEKKVPLHVDEDHDDLDQDLDAEVEDAEEVSRPQRRPGRAEKFTAKARDEDDDQESSEDLESEFEESENLEKVEINFRGSELLRAKFPKPFKVAEAVATDWVHNGSFENLPVGHPLAQWAAQKGLTKAKEMEKKVLESPTLEKVAMEALTLGMKAQGFIQKIKAKMGK